MRKILSIDWDYVTGDCGISSDGHCGFCYDKEEFRKVKLSPEVRWRSRYKKLKNLSIKEGTPLYVAECHASIMEIIQHNAYTVFDFDYHYDNYTCYIDELHCGNWIKFLNRNGGRVICCPDDIENLNSIFICKSSPWTPKKMDRWFFMLVLDIASKCLMAPNFIGHKGKELEGEYNSFLSVETAELGG